MIITKCDRCKQEITPQNDDNELLFTGKRGTAFGIDKRMNLCKKCLDDFNAFMLNHRV